MNKLAAAVAAGLILSTSFAIVSMPANAAPNVVRAGHKHVGMLEKLTQELNLTPDQVSKIGPIIDTARAKTKAIRQDTTLTADQQKAQLGPIHKQEMADIKAVLTPDQLATLKSLRKNHAPVTTAPTTTTTTTSPTTPTTN